MSAAYSAGCTLTAIFQTAANNLPVMDKLLAAYKRVGQAFPDFERFDAIEIVGPDVQQLLANCLADIFVFLEQCCKLFAGNGE